MSYPSRSTPSGAFGSTGPVNPPPRRPRARLKPPSSLGGDSAVGRETLRAAHAASANVIVIESKWGFHA